MKLEEIEIILANVVFSKNAAKEILKLHLEELIDCMQEACSDGKDGCNWRTYDKILEFQQQLKELE
jgi:hypothetical protein